VSTSLDGFEECPHPNIPIADKQSCEDSLPPIDVNWIDDVDHHDVFITDQCNFTVRKYIVDFKNSFSA